MRVLFQILPVFLIGLSVLVFFTKTGSCFLLPHRSSRYGLAQCLSSPNNSGKGELYSTEDDDLDSDEAGLRKLRNKLISKGLGYGEEELKDFTTQWAHYLVDVKVGSVLLDTGTYEFLDSQQYFSNSVVLIVRDDPDLGTAGLILNKPTDWHVGDFVDDDNLRILPEFSASPVYYGGEVGAGRTRADGLLCLECVNVLHRQPGYREGAAVGRGGLWLGGLGEAARAVREGRAAPGDFKFFTKYCGWVPGQLAGEMRDGLWLVAAVDEGTVLGQDPRDATGRGMWRGILERMMAREGPPPPPAAPDKEEGSEGCGEEEEGEGEVGGEEEQEAGAGGGNPAPPPEEEKGSSSNSE